MIIDFHETLRGGRSMGREWRRKLKRMVRELFAQIVVISRFDKNLDSYPANSLKRNT